MMVLFAKNNSEVTIEIISMDGALKSRKFLYEDQEADGPDNVFIHYVEPFKLIALLDKQINNIRYFYHSATHRGKSRVLGLDLIRK